MPAGDGIWEGVGVHPEACLGGALSCGMSRMCTPAEAG